MQITVGNNVKWCQAIVARPLCNTMQIESSVRINNPRMRASVAAQ